MEATATGPNRTGAAINPKGIERMMEAVEELSPPMPISTLQMDVERQRYIAEADAVGSIPPAQSQRSKSRKADVAAAQSRSVLLDKLGERMAFERTGTRLYSALITKYLALSNAGEEPLLPARSPDAEGERALDTLQRIRAEELAHFRMLCDIVAQLGGDPTAQTPCADVSGAASIGLMQVVTDPRTTLAQSLNAILTAELTDNAGWELLAQLAEAAGQSQLLDAFAEALAAEQEHLEIVQTWLKSLIMHAPGTPAV
jgi:bacterioferritin (cytochrome b1)